MRSDCWWFLLCDDYEKIVLFDLHYPIWNGIIQNHIPTRVFWQIISKDSDVLRYSVWHFCGVLFDTFVVIDLTRIRNMNTHSQKSKYFHLGEWTKHNKTEPYCRLGSVVETAELSNTCLTLFLTFFRFFDKIAYQLVFRLFELNRLQTRINSGFLAFFCGTVCCALWPYGKLIQAIALIRTLQPFG